MKNFIRLILIFLVVPFLSLMESCQKEDGREFGSVSSFDAKVDFKNQMTRTFYGSTVPIGNGVARAWVAVNTDGDPTSVGINLSANALEGLPDVDQQFVLFFPKVKGRNFYNHMLVDWNAHGHEPPGIYDQPHFDFHFYIIPNEERMAFGPNDNVQFANAPASMYVPSDYMLIPGGVPQMGAHWADLLSPEFSGHLFTKTFIWGSYDGSFIFWEPMITIAYLQTHPNETIPLRQPQAFQRDGWYPMNYKIAYSTSPNEYTIALTDLMFHEGE